jgi:Domain of unknown function (DUF4328)
MAAKAVYLWSCVLQLQLIARAPVTFAQAQANDVRHRIVSVVVLAMAAVALVFYFVWIFRAKRKAIQLGAEDTEYSPGLVIGCHFIPIGNLFMPLQAMRELWKASISPREWRGQSVSPMVTMWWALWIATGIAGYAIFFVSRSGRGVDHLRFVTLALLFSSTLSLVCYWLLYLIVGRVSAGLRSNSEAASLAPLA